MGGLDRWGWQAAAIEVLSWDSYYGVSETVVGPIHDAEGRIYFWRVEEIFPGQADRGDFSLEAYRTKKPWFDSWTALVDRLRQADWSSVEQHGHRVVYSKKGPGSVRVNEYYLCQNGEYIGILPTSALIWAITKKNRINFLFLFSLWLILLLRAI